MSGPGFSKDPLLPSHGDSLADQSFQSLKSKEVRDSISPTRDIKFHSLALNQPSTTGWDVRSSSEVTPDGRAFRSETVATTDGTEKLNGGVAEFKGRNEQRSSASHQGDDKNFVKNASESSNTHLQENVVIGDENSGRTEIKKSSTTTSSSQVFSSSSTTQYDDGVPHGQPQPIKYITDGNVDRHYDQQQQHHQQHHQQQQQQHQQRLQEEQYRQQQQLRQQHEEERRMSTSQQQQQQTTRQEQRNETYNQNRQDTSQNIESQSHFEENKRYVDMDKATPEYQRQVQYLMSQPGEIISNTVEYPKPNVKMIVTVKRLPDGTIVKNKRYETEELTPTKEHVHQRNSTTSTNATNQRNTTQRRVEEENLQTRLKNSRERNTATNTTRQISPQRRGVDNVDNVENVRYVPDRRQQLVESYPQNTEDITNTTSSSTFSTVKKSSRRFSTETTSETIEETDDRTPNRGKPQDFSTHGFPSVRSNKPTQEYPNDRPRTAQPSNDYSTQGFPSVKPHKPTQQYPTDRPSPIRSTVVDHVTQREVPDSNSPNVRTIRTEDGDVIVVSKETQRNVKQKSNSERIVQTEVVSDVGNGPQITHSTTQHHKSEDFSTHGFPSVKDSSPVWDDKPRHITPTHQQPHHGTPTREHPHQPHAREDFTTHGFPSVKETSPVWDDKPRHVTPTQQQPQHGTPTHGHPHHSHPSEDFTTHGFPSVKDTSPVWDVRPTQVTAPHDTHGCTVDNQQQFTTENVETKRTQTHTQSHKTNAERIIEVVTDRDHPQYERPGDDYSTHGFPSVRDVKKTRDISPVHVTPVRDRAISPRRHEDYSTHGFPSARSPTRSKPDYGFPSTKSPTRSKPDYSSHGFPSARDVKPKPHSPPRKVVTSTTTATPKRPIKTSTTTITDSRSLTKQADVDATHRRFAASLRSTSPVDHSRRDSHDSHHARLTPRSSISSTTTARTFRRDHRETSHDSAAPSETSRISSSTVTRQSPGKPVGKTVTTKQTVVKTRNINGSNDKIDLKPQRTTTTTKTTKSPLPGKTVTTTTTTTITSKQHGPKTPTSPSSPISPTKTTTTTITSKQHGPKTPTTPTSPIKTTPTNPITTSTNEAPITAKSPTTYSPTAPKKSHSKFHRTSQENQQHHVIKKDSPEREYEPIQYPSESEIINEPFDQPTDNETNNYIQNNKPINDKTRKTVLRETTFEKTEQQNFKNQVITSGDEPQYDSDEPSVTSDFEPYKRNDEPLKPKDEDKPKPFTTHEDERVEQLFNVNVKTTKVTKDLKENTNDKFIKTERDHLIKNIDESPDGAFISKQPIEPEPTTPTFKKKGLTRRETFEERCKQILGMEDNGDTQGTFKKLPEKPEKNTNEKVPKEKSTRPVTKQDIEFIVKIEDCDDEEDSRPLSINTVRETLTNKKTTTTKPLSETKEPTSDVDDVFTTTITTTENVTTNRKQTADELKNTTVRGSPDRQPTTNATTPSRRSPVTTERKGPSSSPSKYSPERPKSPEKYNKRKGPSSSPERPKSPEKYTEHKVPSPSRYSPERPKSPEKYNEHKVPSNRPKSPEKYVDHKAPSNRPKSPEKYTGPQQPRNVTKSPERKQPDQRPDDVQFEITPKKKSPSSTRKSPTRDSPYIHEETTIEVVETSKSKSASPAPKKKPIKITPTDESDIETESYPESEVDSVKENFVTEKLIECSDKTHKSTISKTKNETVSTTRTPTKQQPTPTGNTPSTPKRTPKSTVDNSRLTSSNATTVKTTAKHTITPKQDVPRPRSSNTKVVETVEETVTTRKKPSTETTTIKDRLRSATRRSPSKPKPDENDGSYSSSPDSSPTRVSERRRSSNISVHTEIIIDHAGSKSPERETPTMKRRTPQKPISSKKPTTNKDAPDSLVNRKFPVTERKESAPVNRVTRRDDDVKMSRSTSENIIKVNGQTKPTQKKPTEPISSTPKRESRPNKCFTTKTINLTTNDRLINSEEIENVIIDIQHAKSSREPSPDKIVPTPVPADFDTGKPRYPDVVQEPEDEPRKKPVIKNIPILEEDTNSFVNCHISEVRVEKTSHTIDNTDYNDEILTQPTIEAPKSLDYPSIDKPDDECILSVHEKVSKFINTAEETNKPKPSSPFQPVYEKSPAVPENDECLLTVDQKVTKFLKTAESITKTPIAQPRDIERPNPEELDEEIRNDECVLSVSEKVNKFINTAEKLAPSTPQKSPELVARMERHISRQSEPGDEEPEQSDLEPFSENHTTELEKKRQKDILTRPSAWGKKPDEPQPTRQPETDDDELVPMSKTHTTDIEFKRQKNILSRPSVFEGRNTPTTKPQSPMPTKKSPSTKPQSPVSPKRLTTLDRKPKEPKEPKETSEPVESDDDELVPMSKTHTTDIEIKRQKEILSRPTAFEGRQTPTSKPHSPIPTKKSSPAKPEAPQTCEPETDEDELVPMSKTHTTDIEFKRQKDILSRPSAFEGRQTPTCKPHSPMPTKKSSPAKPEAPQTCEPETDEDELVPMSKTHTTDIEFKRQKDILSRPSTFEGRQTPTKPHQSPIPTKKSTILDRMQRFETTQKRTKSDEIEKQEIKKSTRNVINDNKKQTTTLTTTRSRFETPKVGPKEPREPIKPTLNGKSPASATKPIPNGKSTSPTTQRKPFEERPLTDETESEIEFIETEQSISRKSSTQSTKKIDTKNAQSKTPTEVSHSPTRRSSSPKKSTNPNSTTTSTTSRVIESTYKTHPVSPTSKTTETVLIESIIEKTPRDSTPNRTHKPKVITESVAARRNIFENTNTEPTAPTDDRRPSYMDHTRSSLEHIRRDSLEVNKTHYARKPSVEDDAQLGPVRPNTTVKFDVPQKSRKHESICEDINIEEIFDLEILEEMLETVTSYELRRRIRAQIRLVKKNVLNTTQTDSKITSSTHKSSMYKTSSSKSHHHQHHHHHEETDIIHHGEKHEPRESSPSYRTHSPRERDNTCKKPRDRSQSPTERKTPRISKPETISSKELYKRTEQVDYATEYTREDRDDEHCSHERSPYSPARQQSPSNKPPIKPRDRSHSPEVVKSKPSTERGSPVTKPRDRSQSPQKSSNVCEEKRTSITKTSVRTPSSPDRKSQKPKPDAKTPIWADRKNILKTPGNQSPVPNRKTPSSSMSRTSATRTSNVTTSQRQTKLNEEDSITSSYGIGPTDENGLPLFGIKALKKKNSKPYTDPCETNEEVTGYVIEEQWYSDGTKVPNHERKEYIYSTNDEDLKSMKKQVESRNYSKDDAKVTRKFQKIEKGEIPREPQAIMSDDVDDLTASKKYVRRGSVKEMSEKFIRKESSQSINNKSTTKSNAYPKAGLILRTNSRKGSLGADDDVENLGTITTTTTRTTKTSSKKQPTTTTYTTREYDNYHIADDDFESAQAHDNYEREHEYEQHEQQSQTRSFHESESECDSLSTKREFVSSSKKSSSAMSSSSQRSFLNTTGESRVVTDVDDVLERMRNADNVVETGDTAEDQEARALLNKFLGASVIMRGVETGNLISSPQTNQETKTTTSTNYDDGNKVTTTRVTKTIKTSGSSSTPVTYTTCDIEEIWDEEILKQLLERATTYEERRKIRARLRELMAEREATQTPQQQSASTTEKSETKEKDGAVVTTTTKVTTRTVTGGTAPKTVSPFAKFKQLDRQNSQQSQKSPSTPTTPGCSTPTTPGSASLFKFTDPSLNARAATLKDQLLHWCQSKTSEYENVQITNFSTSWSDGLAFCALIHHFLPDAFDYTKLTPKTRRHNFELAFTVADEKAGIAPLLDVEDMVIMQRPDWKSVFVYVQSIYRRFRNCQ